MKPLSSDRFSTAPSAPATPVQAQVCQRSKGSENRYSVCAFSAQSHELLDTSFHLANATMLFSNIVAAYQAQNATKTIRASEIFEIIIRYPDDDKDCYSAIPLYVSKDGGQQPAAVGTFGESIEAALCFLLPLVTTAM